MTLSSPETHVSDARPVAAPRALRLSVEDRREMICEAVIPLILEHGSAVTSRQIAEAAGVAEGTVFRAFGDKESLIKAAVAKHLDPEQFRGQLAEIDPALSLEAKVRAVIELFQKRLAGAFQMAAALGSRRDLFVVPSSDARREYVTIISRMLAPDLERLSFPVERIGPLIRLVTISRSVPNSGFADDLTLDELTQFVLYGIAGRPAPDASA